MRTSSTATRPYPKPAAPAFSPRDLDLDLVGRRQDTPEVVTFDFELAPGQPPLRHLPGQALALTIPMTDGPAIRTFTIASSGLDPNRLSLTIKAAADGHATRFIHEHLRMGDRLRARGPFGRFSLVHHPGEPLLLLGAGSGFTPMMSMLRWLHGRGEGVDVAVVQVARRVEDLLFTDELAAIDGAMPNLTRADCVTTPEAGRSWSGFRGRPDRRLLRVMVPSLERRTVFCCGPAPFMEAMARIHRAEGGDPGCFLTETFGAVRPMTPAVFPTEAKETVGWTARFRGRSFAAPEGVVLTQAAAAANLRVPTGCQEGLCGTCKLKLLEGQVHMEHHGGLTAREEADGHILACCSTPLSDVVLADLG
ncbi:flavin reductase family protein [Rhodospirillum sp. A1_3_36]|uniref:flavin reductase family protein n=1 Tax=Rhodospirillum sp. A1_3_36 TaxID=3391666 RepID=UPI0039A4335C